MKPGDFHLNMIDFFSILLPGIAMTAILVEAGAFANLFELNPLASDGGSYWLALGFVSYAVGHLVYSLASVMDSALYDPVRRMVWPNRQNDAYEVVRALRDATLGADADIQMNPLAFAKGLLIIKAPTAYAEIHRHEADSKFFRSLVVVLFFAACLFAFRDGSAMSLIALLLAAACFWRYAERRYRGNMLAYRYTIMVANHEV